MPGGKVEFALKSLLMSRNNLQMFEAFGVEGLGSLYLLSLGRYLSYVLGDWV